MRAGWPALAIAAATGAALMYLLDPDGGARRRARLRHGSRDLPEIPATPRAAAADDAQLRQQVHTSLGRLVSHPRALDVRVSGGVVRLSGAVLAKERDGLLHQVSAMPGVQRVVNTMTAHDFPSGIVA